MRMKNKILTLRDDILDNKRYLTDEYKSTHDILLELTKIINWDMSHSLILYWWTENEDKIDTIYKLLERQK